MSSHPIQLGGILMRNKRVALTGVLLMVGFYPALVGCSGQTKQNVITHEDPVTEVKFLALGDSYTIGESVARQHRWPVQLRAAMREKGCQLAEPHIIAQTGWTTAELSAAMRQANLQPGYDLVTLLIGVNNQFRGRGTEEFRIEFRGLLQRAIKLAKNDPQRVIVLSIPDYGVTPFGKGRDGQQIGQELDRFNAIKEEEARTLGAHYVDNTVASRAAFDDRTLVATDGLHPSGKLYKIWAEATLPIALKVLR